MTVEIISWSISTKVWDRAGIELATPWSAVRHASVARHVTDCATRPGLVWYNNLGIFRCTYLRVSVYNLKKNIVFFCPKILFYFNKQCRPWWNAALCGISSGSSLFLKVPVWVVSCFLVKGFTGLYFLRVRNRKIILYFPIKTYAVGTQKNLLNETVLLRTQNICLKLHSL